MIHTSKRMTTRETIGRLSAQTQLELKHTLTRHPSDTPKHCRSPDHSIEPRRYTPDARIRRTRREHPSSRIRSLQSLPKTITSVTNMHSNDKNMMYVSSPTARPNDAPIAIVGRNIPAGTIMPNVHAVKTVFKHAVTMRRNTFSHMAVGLHHQVNEVSCLTQ